MSHYQLARTNYNNDMIYRNNGINQSFSSNGSHGNYNNDNINMSINTVDLPDGHTDYPNNVHVYKATRGDSVDVSIDYTSRGSSLSSNINVSMPQTSPCTNITVTYRM
eukprot:Tbor_TRINITY_DN5046_c0_g1::TRINITY_DN5046_c0_g1_i1::g.14082::m.14082